jgi:hypothetical protein
VEKREPKVIENVKAAMFVKSAKSSAIVNEAMSNLVRNALRSFNTALERPQKAVFRHVEQEERYSSVFRRFFAGIFWSKKRRVAICRGLALQETPASLGNRPSI